MLGTRRCTHMLERVVTAQTASAQCRASNCKRRQNGLAKVWHARPSACSQACMERRVCRHLAVQVVDGHMRQRAIVPIDAAHNLVHHAAQPLRAHRPPLALRVLHLNTKVRAGCL